MKKEEALNKSKLPKARYNKELDKYENMPLFQKKVDKANEILAKNPPYEAIKAIENQRIKVFFVEGKNAAQIAALMKMSETDVSLRLQELGLVETNACV
jgi:hypothetical protein